MNCEYHGRWRHADQMIWKPKWRFALWNSFAKKSNYIKSNDSCNCNWLAFSLFIYHIPRIINLAGALLFTYAKVQVSWLMHFEINVSFKTFEIIFKCHDLLQGSGTIKSNEERRPTI